MDQSVLHAAFLPPRAAYLIAEGSTEGFRRAVECASTRWGGVTEPIVVVGAHGLAEPVVTVLRMADVESLVRVDAPIGASRLIADELTLDLIELDAIDMEGDSVEPWGPPVSAVWLGNADDTALVVMDESAPLWQVAAVGYLSPETRAELPADLAVRPPMQEDEVARHQLWKSTLIAKTTEELDEHGRTHVPRGPALVWVTESDSVEDCVDFWNIRALDSLQHPDAAPLLLLPGDGVQHWLNFDKQVASHMLSRPSGYSPDVLLCSHTTPEEQLHSIAGTLSLVPGGPEEVRYTSSWWPTPSRRAPFTYQVNADPLRRRPTRKWGRMVSIEVHQFADVTRARIPSPVNIAPHALLLIRLWGTALKGLPCRDSVAEMISTGASWRDGCLQLVESSTAEHVLDLRIPSLDQVTHHLLEQSTQRYELSDKGKMGTALMSRSDITQLLRPNLYEALIGLTTKRTAHFVKELKKLRMEAADRAELEQLAASWGGRSPRMHRSANGMGRLQTAPAAEAMEAVSAMGWAERGLSFTCNHCRLDNFIPLRETQAAVQCAGCRAPGAFERDADGIAMHYRLDSFVDRACDNGVLPHLLVIAALAREQPHSYFLPGVDVWKDGSGSKREADIYGLYGGRLLAGEVKTQGTEFAKPGQLQHDVEVSAALGADIHLMAAIDAISHEVRQAAQLLCDERGVELLILDRAALRPAS